jgi:hypothetical protein
MDSIAEAAMLSAVNNTALLVGNAAVVLLAALLVLAIGAPDRYWR